MIINVHMVNGVTFQFASRADFARVLAYEPDQADRVVTAWVKWRTDDPDWIELRLPFVRKHSVAFVVAAEDVADATPLNTELPAKPEAERRLAQWREKEAAQQKAPAA